MRMTWTAASALALTLLAVTPAAAGGDWGDGWRGRGYHGPGYYSGYLRGDRPFYDGMYYRAPGYARGPFPVPYVWSYGYSYGLNPGYRFSRDRVVYVYPGRVRGDYCAVGRHGRYYCD